jgi:tetratricopeptide (TPR) repeat protein
MRTAAELAPTTSSINAFYGMGLYQARRYDEAITQLKAAIELDPSVPAAYLWLGTAYSITGNYNEAIENLQKGGEVGRDRPNSASGFRGGLAFAYAVAGRRKEAEAILDEFQKRPIPPSSSIALIYTGLGNKDHAFFWLNKAAEHKNNLIQLKVDPRWDTLRSDRRFQDLLSRINFPN